MSVRSESLIAARPARRALSLAGWLDREDVFSWLMMALPLLFLVALVGYPLLSLGSVDGELYGVWFKAANKSTVWYNADIYDGAGATAPEDWDGFMEQLQLVQDSGYYGISVGAETSSGSSANAAASTASGRRLLWRRCQPALPPCTLVLACSLSMRATVSNDSFCSRARTSSRCRRAVEAHRPSARQACSTPMTARRIRRRCSAA